MEKTKAAFRALRDDLGFVQQDVADELDVSIRTVKRWESLNSDQSAPDWTWDYLLAKREQMTQMANAAVTRVLQMHSGDDPVVITYYRTQEELDRDQLPDRDEAVGFVNAVSRLCVKMLNEKHIECVIVYPEQREFVYREDIDE